MNNNITKVYLLNVPLENDYKNTLYFTSKENQESYFQSRIVKSYSDFSYQRKDSFIRVPSHFDNLQNVNYVMYQNTAYSNKWFYAFVTDIKYVDDGRTDVYIETDYLQTWFFDYTVKSSFVEREHVDNDTVGKNTFPEGLETGEYECQSHETDSNLDNVLSDLCYIMASTSEPISGDAKDTPSGSDLYNGIYSGVKYYRYDSVSAIDIVLEIYSNSAKTESISSLFMIPKVLAPLKEDVTFREVATSEAPVTYTVTKTKNTGIGGYSPRNKKLLCYPYNYLVVSNNNGANAIYHYEKFSGSNCSFTVKGALTPGGSIRMTPNNYNGIPSNDEESINLGKFPICNFSNDAYTNWLTQNSINIGNHTISSDDINIFSSVASTLFSLAVGGASALAGGSTLLAGGMVANGISGSASIGNALIQKNKHDKIPSQAKGNLNCGDVITSDSKNTFHFYKMSIKQEYAKMIDEYFDMFGYQVNRVKVPNKNHRPYYWYTKTIDVNIDGAIPNKDMQVIKDCYNRGITFWKDASKIQDYSVDNTLQSV